MNGITTYGTKTTTNLDTASFSEIYLPDLKRRCLRTDADGYVTSIESANGYLKCTNATTAPDYTFSSLDYSGFNTGQYNKILKSNSTTGIIEGVTIGKGFLYSSSDTNPTYSFETIFTYANTLTASRVLINNAEQKIDVSTMSSDTLDLFNTNFTLTDKIIKVNQAISGAYSRYINNSYGVFDSMTVNMNLIEFGNDSTGTLPLNMYKFNGVSATNDLYIIPGYYYKTTTTTAYVAEANSVTFDIPGSGTFYFNDNISINNILYGNRNTSILTLCGDPSYPNYLSTFKASNNLQYMTIGNIYNVNLVNYLAFVEATYTSYNNAGFSIVRSAVSKSTVFKNQGAGYITFDNNTSTNLGYQFQTQATNRLTLTGTACSILVPTTIETLNVTTLNLSGSLSYSSLNVTGTQTGIATGTIATIDSGSIDVEDTSTFFLLNLLNNTTSVFSVDYLGVARATALYTQLLGYSSTVANVKILADGTTGLYHYGTPTTINYLLGEENFNGSITKPNTNLYADASGNLHSPIIYCTDVWGSGNFLTDGYMGCVGFLGQYIAIDLQTKRTDYNFIWMIDGTMESTAFNFIECITANPLYYAASRFAVNTFGAVSTGLSIAVNNEQVNDATTCLLLQNNCSSTGNFINCVNNTIYGGPYTFTIDNTARITSVSDILSTGIIITSGNIYTSGTGSITSSSTITAATNITATAGIMTANYHKATESLDLFSDNGQTVNNTYSALALGTLGGGYSTGSLTVGATNSVLLTIGAYYRIFVQFSSYSADISSDVNLMYATCATENGTYTNVTGSLATQITNTSKAFVNANWVYKPSTESYIKFMVDSGTSFTTTSYHVSIVRVG